MPTVSAAGVVWQLFEDSYYVSLLIRNDKGIVVAPASPAVSNIGSSFSWDVLSDVPHRGQSRAKLKRVRPGLDVMADNASTGWLSSPSITILELCSRPGRVEWV